MWAECVSPGASALWAPRTPTPPPSAEDRLVCTSSAPTRPGWGKPFPERGPDRADGRPLLRGAEGAQPGRRHPRPRARGRAGGRLQGPARHRASCWVKAWAAPPARRGSDDCAVPRATKFHLRAALSAPSAPPSRPGNRRAGEQRARRPSTVHRGAAGELETVRAGGLAARAGKWRARRSGRRGAAGSAGREPGGRVVGGVGGVGRGPAAPCGHWFAAGLQRALMGEEGVQGRGLQRPACGAGPPARALQPHRRGVAAPPAPSPLLPLRSASRGKPAVPLLGPR